MMPTVMTTGSTAATTTMMTAAAEAATPHEAARSRARGCVCPALPISGSRSTASIAPSPATVRHLLARARALLQQYSVQYSNQRMHAHGVQPPPLRGVAGCLVAGAGWTAVEAQVLMCKVGCGWRAALPRTHQCRRTPLFGALCTCKKWVELQREFGALCMGRQVWKGQSREWRRGFPRGRVGRKLGGC